MYKGKKCSLIFPAYNEEENIGQAVKEFRALKCFDEILVIDNNSRDRTGEIARKEKAKVIRETKQGYGFALRRGMKEARGDYLVLCEPDGTFVAQDTFKLLGHIDKYDLVLGTRTSKKFITKKANMGPLLRYGNILLAKITALLYRTNSLSDCGCTFRVFQRPLAKKILPHLTVGGSHFLPETVVLTALSGGTLWEVPVRYRARIGTSKITGSLKKTITVGFRMGEIVFRYRFLSRSKISP